jgi:hypothetical protein
MSLPSRLLGANPSIQVSTLLSGSLSTPSAKQAFNSPEDFDSIQTVTVGSGGSATVTFTSIPATYTHLQVRALSKDSRTNANSAFDIRFNGDTASNYSTHDLSADGSTVFVGGTANLSAIGIGNSSGGTNANIFGAQVVDILDYANTNKYKTVRTLSGHDQNGSGFIMLISGNWRNTAAVTSITIIPLVANIEEYSQFALYGIKGA